MRITLFLIFAVILQSFANESYSQKTKLSLDFSKTKLINILDEIEENSEFFFLFNEKLIDTNREVTVSYKNKKVDEILDKLFEGTDVVYTISDRKIILAPEYLSENAQQHSISGTVTDEAGEPLPGVTVFIKGTTQGTVTNGDGNYTLSNVPEGTSLQFSFVGMLTQEVEVGGQTTINVTMAVDAIGIEEVVAIGYGTLKKRDLSGAITSINSKDFEKQSVESIDQALQGRSSGVYVNQNSGAPGEGFKIRIRGINSINGSNEPLYVIDGMVVSSISSINPNDIESMEILKDASATAIYGSRGANGVILITTKMGRSGESKFEFNSFYGLSNVTQRLDVMSPAEFAEGVNFAEGKEFYTQQEINELKQNGGENWHDKLFQTGQVTNVQLSANGGNEKINYYLSGDYYEGKGILKERNYKRYSARANVNVQINEKLKVGVNTFFSLNKYEGYQANIGAGLSWDPTTPAYNNNGELNYTSLKPGVGNGFLNPLLDPLKNLRDRRINQANFQGFLDYTLGKGFKLNISGGYQSIDGIDQNYNHRIFDVDQGPPGTAQVKNTKTGVFQNTNMLTYSKEWVNNHKLQVNAIHEQQYIKELWTLAEGTGHQTDLYGYRVLAAAPIQRISNSSVSESLQSFLGRVNYNFDDKYLLTASLRADGSSKFREENRWGYFPSGSIAWRLSEESFIKDKNSSIDNLKLRLSAGITGSQAVPPLATRSSGELGANYNYPFNGQGTTIGIAPTNRLANEDLTWEKTSQVNLGVDLGLWKSKLTLSLDLYQKKTSDLLLDVALPIFAGPTVVTQNIGDIENKGFDIELGAILYDKNDWNISTKLNISHFSNKVVSLVDDEPIAKGKSYLAGMSGLPTRIEIGQPISTFRGFVFEGVYQQNEADLAAEYSRVPGDAKYKDINNDGLITVDDITNVGSGLPDLTGGLNTIITWKNVDFSFLLIGSYGNDIYNLQRAQMMALGQKQFHATHIDYANRWTPDNSSNIPSGRDGTEALSTQFLEDGSYLTMKNVSLGYTLKGKVIEKLRVYTSIENLFILTNYSGFDPETTATGSSDIDVGIDYNTFPLSRTFKIGINLSF